MDGPDDREAGLRTPGQPLRLHQEGGQLLLLVPRRLIAQEGVPGRRGALIAPGCALRKINVNESIEILRSGKEIFLIKKVKLM